MSLGGEWGYKSAKECHVLLEWPQNKKWKSIFKVFYIIQWNNFVGRGASSKCQFHQR
jgi:hypothetical protein